MSKKTKLLVKDIGEVGLIKRIGEIIGHADPQVLISIGDDTAVIKPDNNYLQLVTTDILVEDVHFRLETYTPFEIGYRAIVVNVSDIAAMAGFPRYAVVSIGFDPHTGVDFIEDIYRGMKKASEEYGLSLIGGDTTRATKLLLNVAIIGYVEEEMLCLRSSAQVGDEIAVTGRLGASTAGLYLLSNPQEGMKVSSREQLKRAHIVPKARVKEARIAAKGGAHALEDISDGLASEIRHICEMSNVGAKIQADSLPYAVGVEETARIAKRELQSFALYGGEDFELVFTVPRGSLDRIKEEMYQETGTIVTRIGWVVDIDEGITIEQMGGELLPLNYGFEHF